MLLLLLLLCNSILQTFRLYHIKYCIYRIKIKLNLSK